MNRYSPHDLNLNHECFFYDPLKVLGNWQDRDPGVNLSIAILFPTMCIVSRLESAVHIYVQRMETIRRTIR